MKLLLPLLIVLALASCASRKERETPPLISQRMASRLSKPDMNRRSIYDKNMQASLNQKSDSGAWFGRQKHHSKSFSDTKSFTQTPGFKTNTFAGADDKSRMGRQSFAQSTKTPAYADDAFGTSASRFANQKARDAGRTFADAGDAFGTSANRDALKAQEKNRRPEFIKLEEYSKDPAYSEEQVRKLLGRD